MRTPLVVPLFVALGGLVVLVGACLPDLEIAPVASMCGDGFIDPDAGEECDPGSADAGTPSPCVACKVSCAVGAFASFEDPTTHHCYFQTGPTITSSAASGACEQAAGHVVRFVSEGELALVAPKGAATPFWVGLDRTLATVWRPSEPTFEPGWTPTCAGCFAAVDGGPIPPDPTQTVPDGTCVAGSTDPTQSWTESPCSSAKKTFSRQTICEREPVGIRARACGANVCLTALETQETKIYVVTGMGGAGLGANDAVLACGGLGGRLAVFGTPEEREQVGHEIGAYFSSATSVWIGLSDTNGTWSWDADGGSKPPPWGAAEPSVVNAPFGRAYVTVDNTKVDSELAHAADATDGGAVTHAALCEVP